MGLIGGMARTAVVAGTATAVSNRVSRRQANRWAAKRSHKKRLLRHHHRRHRHSAQPAASSQSDMLDALQKLGELKSAGSSPRPSSNTRRDAFWPAADDRFGSP